MAERYIYHGGSNTSPYGSWAAAATTFSAGSTGGTSTDNYWVASDHAETAAAATTITFPNSTTNMPSWISVNRAGSVPPVAADVLDGATVTTTGAFNISLGGRTYVRGVTFNAGTGATAANLTITGPALKFENCIFNVLTTATTSAFQLTSASTVLTELKSCSISFGDVAQNLTLNGRLRWTNPAGVAAITGTVFPTTFIVSASAVGGSTLTGLDLSPLGAGKTLVGANVVCRVEFVNCKLDANVTVAATPVSRGARGTWVIGCDSGGTVARNEIYAFHGTLTTETTIKRTSGASDGTTAYSWKLVPNANNRRWDAMKTFEGALWNTSTGSAKTLTVHTVTDNVSLTDAEIWLEVDYLGSAATPISSSIDDASANVLTTGAAQATSTEAWTTTGLTTPLKQKLEVTFTPQMVGPIRWRVRYAKTSTTVYICPKAELS